MKSTGNAGLSALSPTGDIVLEVLAQEVDVTKISVGDIMSGDLLTVREHEGIFQTIQLMRAKGLAELLLWIMREP